MVNCCIYDWKINLRNALDKMDTDNKITDVLEKDKMAGIFMHQWLDVLFIFLVCFISVARKRYKILKNIQISDTPN
jgi:hypothetical protein